MAELRYVKGDATSPVGEGNKILIHCCNNIGAWGAGFVVALSRKWKDPEVQYRKWGRGHCKLNYQLGNVQFVKVEDDIVVGNMLGQEGIRRRSGTPPIRYAAIVECLLKVKDAAKSNNASVHCPRFGAGLAGGKWDIIEGYLNDILVGNGIDVTVYDL